MKKIFSLCLVLLLGVTLSAQNFNDYLKAVEQHNAAYTAERYSVDIAEALFRVRVDTLTVQVEVRQEYFDSGFDTLTPITDLEKKIAEKIRSVLSIGVKVQIKAPNTIERSQGKSKFVIDNRKLQ